MTKMKFSRINAIRHGTETIKAEVPTTFSAADRRRHFSAASENGGLEFAGINAPLLPAEKDVGKIEALVNLLKHQSSNQFRMKSVADQQRVIRELKRIHDLVFFSVETKGYVLGPVYRQVTRVLDSYGHWL